jgi:hypothetical protein
MNFSEILRQLPCPNLLDSELNFSDVQLEAADGYPGVIQGCPKLTRLDLTLTGIDAPQHGVLDSLSSLVHLQHLKIMSMPALQLSGFSVATLPRLQQLTCLLVGSLSLENLSQLGTLINLQELCLVGDDDAVGPTIGPDSVPGLVFPASLKKFELLERFEAGLLSLLPEGLQSLNLLGVMEFEDHAEGHGSFPSCLSRLQHLTSLSLLPANRIQWPPAGPAYSALTASSSLVQLVLCHTGMPDGVWQHVFPAACRLPFLTRLDLESAKNASHWVALAPSWDDADFCRLVSCCPNLCEVGGMTLKVELHFSGLHNEHHELRVPELQKLTCLTRLRVRLDTWDNDHYGVCMRGLAAVTQLRHLTVAAGAGFSAASLLPLTSLTALAHFSVEWIPYNGGGGDSDDEGFGGGGGGGGIAHDDGQFSASNSVQVSQLCSGSLAASRFFEHSTQHGTLQNADN